jgi:hypothetical protein
MRMLTRISSGFVCSVPASVPDAYAQRTHKGQSRGISLQIFKIILKVHKNLEQILLTLTNSLKSYQKFVFRWPN